MKRPALTPRQQAFAELYAASGNGTEAAIGAGYSRKAAAQQAARLLRIAKIQKAVQKIQMKLAGERVASAGEIAETLTQMLRDRETPSGSRIRAGETLLRCGGAFLQVNDDEPEDEPEDGDNFVQIILPWMRSQHDFSFTAVQMEGGEIVPLSGHETDSILYYIAPYDPEGLKAQLCPDSSFAEWDEPDEPVEKMTL